MRITILLGWAVLSMVLARSQSTTPSLVGLPDEGVTLSGDPTSPAIHNNSTRNIIGYTLRFQDARGNGTVEINLRFLALRGGQSNAGIAPGAQAQHSPGPSQGKAPSTGPAETASLDAVLFSDGEFVGPDRSRSFKAISATIYGEQDLDAQVITIQSATPEAKSAFWEQVQRISQGLSTTLTFRDSTDLPGYRFRQKLEAQRLLQTRQKYGDNAALNLATQTSVYPNLWRK